MNLNFKSKNLRFKNTFKKKVINITKNIRNNKINILNHISQYYFTKVLF